ncbi:glycosyltransferase [Mucilaginibacter auburnensis]|uniref:Cellulose synthase/poly-beta-1,6-N-acetylglucosamine synthase-like glycosyltransferase n=1 Tax=Mucilaginibacter auburnensis TaxID=1457233 RepID=A0A2H9VSG8_9SPHI|nr:glycosyltransferase [Mucilaginibacter auburnensis]PJJ83764.1 cellulose synthase/poly-beta-1,6-N-acetylglucosamine synthase-like glycosyltransferase [Mucilaginibacter auburnensis]
MRHKQIFQADTPKRWNKIKWISRILIFVLICGVVAAAITVTSQTYPELPNLNPAPKRISDEELEQYKKSTRYKDYKIDKKQLQTLEAKRHNQLKHANNKERINAAFYREWETQAYNSLKENIGKLDMVVTEGFFINPKADTIGARMDTGLLNINKRYNKPVVVSISNYVNYDNVNGDFDVDDVVRITGNKALRKVFINSIIKQLKKYNLRGINLDINNIPNRNGAQYRAFQEDLYNMLHPLGFLVTQNVIPDDDTYDLKHLQRFNDYLFVMAIDQHTEDSNAGDISHQHWVEEQLDRVCEIVPSEKVILTIAGGGVDWPKNSVGTSIGYQAAVSTAEQYQKKVIFDPVSANLHYKYIGPDSIEHTVYFVDAAANFNIMRMADDWDTGGIALWRLGSEDPRLWKFFQKNLALASLKKTGLDVQELNNVALNNKIDYTGNGEVLEIITTPSKGNINLKIDTNSYVITNQEYLKLPTKYVIKKFGYKPGKVVLTFDDGPDPDFTPRILEILKREKVPASFFVVGAMVEKNIPLLKRIHDEGYEIGNHTFLHPDISKVSLDRVILELNATRKLIESITGHSTILFRPPFNADAEPQTLDEVIPVAESRKQNYITIGESIDPWDWQPGVTAQQIIDRTKRDFDKGSMILLHDAGGDTREATVQALPEIIRFYKSKGYEFTTIADILDKKKEELMPPIKDDANSGVIGTFYDAVVVGFFFGNWFLFYVFLSAIFLAIGRIVLIGVLAIRQRSENEKSKAYKQFKPVPVSIIVPAYNEEVTVVKSLRSLLNIDYPEFELIFIDDGSKDNTLKVVTEEFADEKRITILTKPNGGKASALNFGIAHAKYDFAVCIDADTQLKNDAVYHLMTYFTDDEVGAVAGTVKVGNETNIITKWQSIEYITAQNMDRRAFDLINSITVVPGAIGAFRKSAVDEAGGFTSDTLAEDCDLTMRILKCGYIIRNAAEAVAYTEAPETLGGLLKQRFRWSFGVIQSFWKNRNALFNKKFKSFGMVGMPNILIFQIILPLFSPLADLMMIFGLFGDKPWKILSYYVAFVLIDFIVSIIAFWMEKESYKKLVYIIPQRFIWRQLMYYILFKAIRKAVKGELSTWGDLKRTGNVKEDIVTGGD